MARVSNRGRGDQQGWERQDTGRQGQRHQHDRITGREGHGRQNASHESSETQGGRDRKSVV